MKRMTYVDESGNTVNQSLERKRPLLNFFFVFGTVLPIILIGFIIYNVVINVNCLKVYNTIKTASYNFLKDDENLPNLEGESVKINISDLYDNGYLSSINTNNMKTSGTVKVTRYKKDYIYTLDVKNCEKCSTNMKYGSWSGEVSYYPSDKAIIDVIPYYNYYERDVSTTKWSEYYDSDELSDETSKYGIKLPLDEETLPEIPTEAKIFNIENDTTYYYRYRDRTWKWYDIVGDYSTFTSTQPSGYANKDESSERYTDWSEYSLNYPKEADYRTITSTTGYKFYYENSKGKKIYYNSGKYTAREDVNTEKYNMTESDTATLYRYRDKQWRWYNGTKRRYSSLRNSGSTDYPYKDYDTETLGNASSWSSESNINTANQEYRTEERKLMTRFRIEYETISLKVLKTPLNRADFTKKVRMSVPQFAKNKNYKLEVTYKFKYKKS